MDLHFVKHYFIDSKMIQEYGKQVIV